jgi:Ca2+-binding EF-hand superfamily protein
MMRGWSMSVTLACMLGVLVPSGGVFAQATTPPDAKTWVREHDKNGDGKLDREEFHQAVIESFFFRDTNKVGYLTINELRGVTPEERKACSATASSPSRNTSMRCTGISRPPTPTRTAC